MEQTLLQDRPMPFEERREPVDGDGELNLRDILSVLRRRKRFIAITFTIVLVITAIVTFLSTPIYQARTKLLVASSGKTFGSGGTTRFP